MLKVYVDLMSQPSRALYLFVKHTRIPHTIVPVALRKGEQIGEEYTQVNLFRQVPAIEDDGVRLEECVAILTYLCAKYKITSLYPHNDLVQKARIDAFTHWQHMRLRIEGARLFGELVLKAIVDHPIKDFGIEILKASLSKIEKTFLKDTPFVYSDHMSIADLLGVCELMQVKLQNELEVEKMYPKITKWISNVRDTVGPELFDEAHRFVKKPWKVVKTVDFSISKL